MNRQLVVMTLGLSLFGLGCSKVCEQKPLSGEWAKHADLVPPDATTCGGTETSLKLGFEGKSGPHSFKIMTEYIGRRLERGPLRRFVDGLDLHEGRLGADLRGARPEAAADGRDADEEALKRR